ncbi:hypothetical protein [Campylobacter sp. US33a]|uniref:hypothetical protein n=1 Tax=Campylobacter sp. US33a TaxID=2498120 RepID=UPI00106755D5|nr:hypothetical protein [Campylobacter sp. US33a]TEY00732.1 hypothetical protein ELQ16_08845 [Campylobacter sp. US33a]
MIKSILLLSSVTIFLLANPTSAINKLNESQKKGNELVERQNKNLNIALELSKFIYVKKNHLSFLINKRNKLLHNQINLKSNKK